MKKIIAICLLTVGCTDVGWQKATNFGQSFEVKCYSGGTLIYKGRSTGRLENEEQSDGWAFVDAETGQFTRVSGDCLIHE